MAGPWEQFGSAPQPAASPQADGPWAKFGAQEEKDDGFLATLGKAARNVINDPSRLEQTWPVQMAKGLFETGKSIATLPGDVAAGKVAPESPEAIARAAQTAMALSPIPAASRAGAGWAGAQLLPKVAKPVAPTVQALEEAAAAGYDKARGLGVEIQPQAVSQLGGTIRSKLEEQGVHGELAPKTFRILKELETPPEGSVAATLANLETLRRTFGHASKDFSNPTEQLAARSAIRDLDDYLAAIPDQDVIRGPAKDASKILSDARGNYAAARRSEKITDEVENADRSAAAANSGQNIGNANRQRINSILKSDKKSAGYSPEEIAAMEGIVRGTLGGNVARGAGNMLGGGGGIGAAVAAALGATATAPFYGVGAVAPLVGAGLKKLSDRSVRKGIENLDERIRMRSPLAKEPVLEFTAPALKKAAIARALMASQMSRE